MVLLHPCKPQSLVGAMGTFTFGLIAWSEFNCCPDSRHPLKIAVFSCYQSNSCLPRCWVMTTQEKAEIMHHVAWFTFIFSFFNLLRFSMIAFIYSKQQNIYLESRFGYGLWVHGKWAFGIIVGIIQMNQTLMSNKHWC